MTSFKFIWNERPGVHSSDTGMSFAPSLRGHVDLVKVKDEEEVIHLKQILIVGGTSAGVSAALRAREVYPIVGITIVVEDKYPNFSVCGLSSDLSGETPEWSALARRTAEQIEKMGIRLLLEHRARHIDVGAKRVEISDMRGRTRMLPYERLILAPNAASAKPSLPGTDLPPGVFCLRCMDDAISLGRYLTRSRPKSAIILGSDPIGMEMADALTRRGLSVIMLVRSGAVLKTVDPRLQSMVRSELGRHGVKLIDHIDVTALEEREGSLVVRNEQNMAVRGDLILLATGTSPEADLAKAAGIPLGMQGAIRVNRAMETGLGEIYAAGECVETWHRLLKKNVYLPLGTTAHKQGRVAGENAAGGHAEFAGSLGTQAIRIFDIEVARTGLRDSEAREAGFDPITSEVESWGPEGFHAGETPLRIRVTGDRRSRQLLGAQIVGPCKAEVSRRIDVFAAAISTEMGVDDLVELDLSYTPRSGGTWDPVQMAALQWTKGLLVNRPALQRPALDVAREDKEATAEQPYSQARLSFAV